MMNEVSEAKGVVYSFIQAFFGGQIDDALEFLDPEIEVLEPIGLPYGGVKRGRQSFADMIAMIGEAWEFPEAIPPKLYDLDDGRVLLDVNFDAVSRATGGAISTPIIEIYTVERKKIVHIQVMVDTALANRVLGDQQ